MRIQHNIMAMNAYRNFSNNTSALSKNLEKLSSGYRINRAGDDAAGLAISEKMRAQITGLETAQKNAKDGISLVQTAEGALTEVHDMLNRALELADQSANGTYDDSLDRAQMQKELDQLRSEINRIADSTNFNGIKLLDGSLDKKISDSLGSTDGLTNLADGMTIDAPVNGAGVKETVDITFNGSDKVLFGAGDSLSFDITNASGTKSTLTFDYSAAAKGHEVGQSVNATGTVTNGAFGGDTFEEQMNSLVASLNNTGALNGEYEASLKTTTDADGNSVVTGVTLTAKSEVVPNTKIAASSVKAQDMQVVANLTTTNGINSDATITAATQMGLNNLIGGTTGIADVAAGDKVKFTFNVNGKDQTVTLEAGTDFAIATSVKDTTTNIANALASATFDDNTGTGIDESQLKVKDYFTFTANQDNTGTAAQGSLKIDAKQIGGKDTANVVKKAEISRDGTVGTTVNATGGAATTTPGTVAAAAQKTEVTFTNDYSVGDKVKLQGTLSDGRTFEIVLEAVAATTPASQIGKNQFALGADATATTKAIADALKAGTNEVTVRNPDNSRSQVASNLLFTGDTTQEFNVSSAGTKLTLTSAAAGVPTKGLAGSISNVETINNEMLTASGDPVLTGKAPSKAVNQITFDPDKVEQGTTLEIDGKTFEFVTDAKYLSKEGNIAVIVDNLGKRDTTGALASDAAAADDIAGALKNTLDALDADDPTTNGVDESADGEYISADGKKYTLTADAGTGALKIESKDVGTAGTALSVNANTPSRNTSVVKFETTDTGTLTNPNVNLNVKVGDTVTIDGKTYEFTDGEHRTKEEGNIGVSLKDIHTAQDAAHALADAVNTEDGGKVIATVDEKAGSVVLTSKFNADADVSKNEDPYAAPKVELPLDSNGLKLQIGDTAEEFNQLTVSVQDMHADSLGIANISIGTQDEASAAVTALKDAINRVSDVRGTLGATQNRLDHTINNLSVMQENIQDAESNIRDVDVAKEMMDYTKNNILIQSAQAMLAQANQVPQGVLQLLQ